MEYTFVNFLENKNECCGCYSCYNICPKKCISMERDEEGFWYPSIESSKCINCDMCRKVCPAVNTKNNTTNPISYIGFNKDDKIRKQSSSGGIFNIIAQSIIDDNGIVFGAAFNDNFAIEHMKVSQKKELINLQGSKYVQSKIGDTYKVVKQILSTGKKVLFTGTPCQIEGLYSYLQNNNIENLYTLDIICHGVPSPKVWESYLQYITKENKVTSVSFRDKKYGWHYFSLKINTDKKKYIKRLDQDIFISLFLDNIILRPSCYNCKYKKVFKNSDFTLADCWRPNAVNSKLKDDDTGLSMIFVNTDKGRLIFENNKDKMVVQEIDYETAIQSQSAITKSVQENPKRSEFFKLFNGFGFDYIYKTWYKNKVSTNIRQNISYYKTKVSIKLRNKF